MFSLQFYVAYEHQLQIEMAFQYSLLKFVLYTYSTKFVGMRWNLDLVYSYFTK